MSIVRKGWMRWERGAKPQRVLVDERGFVFGAGRGDWMIPPDRSILNPLPGTYDWRGWPMSTGGAETGAVLSGRGFMAHNSLEIRHATPAGSRG